MGVISFIGRRLSKRVGPEHRQFRELTGRMIEVERAQCPHCRRGRLRASPGEPEVRVCDRVECGARVPLAELAQAFREAGVETAEAAARERRYASLSIILAELLVVASAFWAIKTASWATLLGSILIATFLCVLAVVARYRAWQLEQGRMFELKPPFGAYLSWEVAGLLRRR